jgi:hypothetical protein
MGDVGNYEYSMLAEKMSLLSAPLSLIGKES